MAELRQLSFAGASPISTLDALFESLRRGSALPHPPGPRFSDALEMLTVRFTPTPPAVSVPLSPTSLVCSLMFCAWCCVWATLRHRGGYVWLWIGTLFVRNVKYETDSQEVRDKFEQMGEIKIFFDLISTRGMAFITYYDLRAATMAKQRLQGTEVSGRPIDVHYSLPKDNELERRCDRDKNQATLFLSINEASRPIIDGELRAKFEIYGEIRSIKPFKDSPYPPLLFASQRFVEYWDTRACESAHDSLVGAHYLGGQLELKFAWDTGMVPKGRPDWRAGQDEDRAEFYGPNDGPDYYEHDDDYPAHNGTRDTGNGNGYRAPQMAQPYNSTHIGKEIDEQRLSQAQKVQQLLESLTKAGANGHLNGASGPGPLVSNYPSEPAAAGPKPMGPPGFQLGTALPSNFVPNYPAYPAAPAPEYGQPTAAPAPPQGPTQLAQIMGQLSSFSAPVGPQPYPAAPARRLSAAASPAAPLGLPPAMLALFPQTGAPTGPAQGPQQAALSKPIPTAPRAMQAAAAIASLSSVAAQNQGPAPAPPPALFSAPAAAAPTANPQAAVQQLLALLQQQQQQKQHQHQQ
ncbi:hypothetical protein PTTG_07203 [Puccinia triticina 1-1 BBBD Race 1]|uniref:RRM domain-containing protein n=1 Tax=Puccinia triticina (isolate 1-1 / race 1 (BBBD)) TaxID=630390 RepID=A0A180GS38_PUCT1|nr:hypothetical protein PTTG_07203 [Puccinia triticina 1-1 BBBD Race 1]